VLIAFYGLMKYINNVEKAVKVATDYVAIDADKIRGLTPYKLYIIVEKRSPGEL